MDSVTLKNFRCFREKQTARLAPLTLLVGENSTGKTSFLALIRAIWELAYRYKIPDFKEEPYDLGSFDEIVHRHGGRGKQAGEFQAGFSVKWKKGRTRCYPAHRYDYTFAESATAPVPVRRLIASEVAWTDQPYVTAATRDVRVGTSNGTWCVRLPEPQGIGVPSLSPSDFAFPRYNYPLSQILTGVQGDAEDFVPQKSSPPVSPEDLERLRELNEIDHLAPPLQRPFASAPVRSKPHRTYDPARPTPDPEGDYVPMYLADVFSRDKKAWTALKKGLEDFGQAAGLFDEISIRQFGKSGSEPFQVQVRRFDGRRKGPQRNLIDVGYGVSQILPVIMELLRPDASPLFLLQQPEVHLHPSAQAALGSLFCQVVSRDRQLIVETHSDHLLDRVRMEVRDGRTPLKPEDVSILYFERGDLDVNIHSIRIDEEGNIQGAPDGYRRFFLEETTRSLWPNRTPAAN